MCLKAKSIYSYCETFFFYSYAISIILQLAIIILYALLSSNLSSIISYFLNTFVLNRQYICMHCFNPCQKTQYSGIANKKCSSRNLLLFFIYIFVAFECAYRRVFRLHQQQRLYNKQRHWLQK